MRVGLSAQEAMLEKPGVVFDMLELQNKAMKKEDQDAV